MLKRTFIIINLILITLLVLNSIVLYKSYSRNTIIISMGISLFSPLIITVFNIILKLINKLRIRLIVISFVINLGIMGYRF